MRGFLFDQQKLSIALYNSGNSDIGFPDHIGILQIKKGRVTPAFFNHTPNYLAAASAFLAFICFLALCFLAFFSIFSSALVSVLAGAVVAAGAVLAGAMAASAATAVKETAANTAAISTDNSLLIVNSNF
jgi:hypothetical protein